MCVYKNVIFILFLVAVTGCAESVSPGRVPTLEIVGFWYGLWHGLIIFFSWLASLFYDDVAIYAAYNNGGWYDFGYVIGIGKLGFSFRYFTRADDKH